MWARFIPGLDPDWNVCKQLPPPVVDVVAFSISLSADASCPA